MFRLAMTTFASALAGTGVAVGAGAVAVGDGCGRDVDVAVGALVGDLVGVAVACGVGVNVGTRVSVGLGVHVAVGVGEGVAVFVGSGVFVGFGVAVAVSLGLGVAVGAGLAVGVGDGPAQATTDTRRTIRSTVLARIVAPFHKQKNVGTLYPRGPNDVKRATGPAYRRARFAGPAPFLGLYHVSAPGPVFPVSRSRPGRSAPHHLYVNALTGRRVRQSAGQIPGSAPPKCG